MDEDKEDDAEPERPGSIQPAGRERRTRRSFLWASIWTGSSLSTAASSGMVSAMAAHTERERGREREQVSEGKMIEGRERESRASVGALSTRGGTASRREQVRGMATVPALSPQWRRRHFGTTEANSR